jgi:hypothetical protein
MGIQSSATAAADQSGSLLVRNACMTGEQEHESILLAPVLAVPVKKSPQLRTISAGSRRRQHRRSENRNQQIELLFLIFFCEQGAASQQ